MKKILINVLPAREVRVAVVTTNEGSSPTVLHDLHIEHSNNRPLRGNIYKARVSAVKDELNAAFVDYGDVKQGLLALSRVEPLSRPNDSTEGSSSTRRISDFVKVGDDVLVQVDKDPRSDKGASLTTRIQLHGQHVVFTTNRPRNRISRMITGSEREEINRILSKVRLPKDAGLVIRTSAGGKNMKTLQEDVNECTQLLDLINQAYKQSEAPRLLYEENSMVNTVLRDNLHAQIEEILVDDPEVYHQTVNFVNNFMPDFDGKILLYENALPLFTRYKIEKQSNRIFDREVTLPSGGQIVLDPTEALLAVDVNSAKSKYKNNFADMVLNTNLQAVDELFNQICLRDIGGLIVVDFIDMNSEEDIRKVQDRVERACQRDRHRTKCEPISKFGLMQLQRRRTRSSIYDTAFEKCDTCAGHGKIRTVSSIAYHIFHEIEAKCYDRKVTKIRTHVTPDVAAFLTNELRSHLSVLELQSKSTIEIIPDLENDNSTYVTHSYRNQYSKKPRETETFTQGKPNSTARDRKRNGSRTAPAKSIETAAVTRSDIEKRSKRTRSRPDATSKQRKLPSEKQAPRQSMGATLQQVSLRLASACAYLYRRLFVVAAQPKPSVPKKGRNDRPRPSSQTRKLDKAGTTERKRVQKSPSSARTDSPSSATRGRRGQSQSSGATVSSEAPRAQRRSSEAPSREVPQTDQRRKDSQRAKPKTNGEPRKSDSSTETSRSEERESRRTQRQQQSKQPQAVQDTQSNQSPQTKAVEPNSRRKRRQRDSTEQPADLTQGVVDSSSEEPPVAAQQPISDTEQSVSSLESQESDQKEEVQITSQESEETVSDSESELTNRTTPSEIASAQTETEELETGDTIQEADVSAQPLVDEITTQSEESTHEGESVSSNGKEDDSDSARASNDPRNLLEKRVETRQESAIEVS